MTLFRVAAVLTVVVVLSGCSLLFVESPPQVRPGAEAPTSAVCTSSMTLPTLDLVVGGLNALGGLVLVASEDSTEEDVQIGWGGIGWGTLQLISGSTGRGKVNRCREFLRTPVEPMGPSMPMEVLPDTERPVWSTEQGWTNSSGRRDSRQAVPVEAAPATPVEAAPVTPVEGAPVTFGRFVEAGPSVVALIEARDAIQLVRMRVAAREANETIAYLDGNRVIAIAHPSGEIEFPQR
ncbi:MAG: hypothetical protein OXQ29_03450 [Rhodospirillaceae bacterium]|nr:hypothetical protein [Rhodospirillaceae bacterium]